MLLIDRKQLNMLALTLTQFSTIESSYIKKDFFMKMKSLFLYCTLLINFLFFSYTAQAANNTAILAAQPTTCMTGTFSAEGNMYWKTVSIQLKNQCTSPVNLQDASITFNSKSKINAAFWGNFSPLPWPDNKLWITSEIAATNDFLNTMTLHFPTSQGSTQLNVGQFITLQYGVAVDDHIANSLQVFLATPTTTGSINFTNKTLRPDTLTPETVMLHLMTGTQTLSDISVPWNGSKILSGVAPGIDYTVKADNIKDGTGATWQGSVSPATFKVTANTTLPVTVSYTKQVTPTGSVNIKVPALPSALTGYTGKPTIQVQLTGGTASQTITPAWNTSTAVTGLTNGSTYVFATPTIEYNGAVCTPSFTPSTLIASGTTPPTTTLSYTCSTVTQVQVSFSITGAPTTLASTTVTLTPTDGASSIQRTITLQNGSGSDTISLINGRIYQVAVTPVADYTVNYTPQPLVAMAGSKEVITFTSQAGQTPVAINGRLKVCGTSLCNKNNVAIQLRGMSTHGLQWYSNCLTSASFDKLANDFKAGIVRVSMYIQEDGYETDPVKFTQLVNKFIDEVSKRGMYVIVDWHMLDPGDPNYNLERAKKFFTDIATTNRSRNNMLYEIANEPNGVNWSTIKNYANQLIPVIRAIDPDTVIIVGTPGWSTFGYSGGGTLDEIINSPLNFSNVMYTFHFYAASHGDAYLNVLDRASTALPVFVTEWGTQTYTGDGNNDFTMSEKYTSLMARKKISWTNWNYSDDFRSGAVWKTGTCTTGNWSDSNLKPAGVWVKQKIISP